MQNLCIHHLFLEWKFSSAFISFQLAQQHTIFNSIKGCVVIMWRLRHLISNCLMPSHAIELLTRLRRHLLRLKNSEMAKKVLNRNSETISSEMDRSQFRSSASQNHSIHYDMSTNQFKLTNASCLTSWVKLRDLLDQNNVAQHETTPNPKLGKSTKRKNRVGNIMEIIIAAN